MDHGHSFTILDLHWFFISRCSKILWCQVVLKCTHTAEECELLVYTTDLVRILVKQGSNLFRFLTNLFCCYLSLFISLEGKFPAWQYMYKLVVLQSNDTKLQKLDLHVILCKYFLKQQMNGLIKLLYKHVFLIQQYFCIDSFQPKYFCFMLFWADSSSNLLFNFFFK